MVDNIGFPVSGINMTYNNTGTIGTQDGEIQIKLNEDHRPTAEYVRTLREELPARFPGTTFSFLPADIISQILNFGAPAPIDLQIRGPDLERRFRLRRGRCCASFATFRASPTRASSSRSTARAFDVDVDRTRAQYVGITERDVTNSMVVNLAGSSQVAPTYWLNPENGVSYSIVMQTPQYQIGFAERAERPSDHRAGRAVADAWRHRRHQARQHARGLLAIQHPAAWCRSTAPRRAATSARSPPTCRKSSTTSAKDLPKGVQVVLLGQVRTMNSAFSGLLFGLLGAIVLIYSADRRQLPILDRSVRDHHRAAGGACRHRLDAVCHPHDAVGAGAHRRHHVHGRRHREQRSGHQLRPRAARRTRRSGRRRAGSRLCPLPPGVDDGACHDHRHGADGARPRRRRRTECAARPRRGRRPDLRDHCDADVRPRRFQPPSWTPEKGCQPRQSENRMSPESTRPTVVAPRTCICRLVVDRRLSPSSWSSWASRRARWPMRN